MIDNVLALNNLTVEDAINELGSICEDFIVVCYWAGTKFPCFQNNPFLSWIGSTSHYGACCSFNYHPSVQGSFVPFAVNTYGIHGGLSVVATGFPQASDGKSGALYSEGFMVAIKLVYSSNPYSQMFFPTSAHDPPPPRLRRRGRPLDPASAGNGDLRECNPDGFALFRTGAGPATVAAILRHREGLQPTHRELPPAGVHARVCPERGSPEVRLPSVPLAPAVAAADQSGESGAGLYGDGFDVLD